MTIQRQQEQHGPLSKAEIDERWKLLSETVAEARELTDVDFELNKQDLAERIAPRDVKEELKEEIAALAQG